jgi:hypothetical protein
MAITINAKTSGAGGLETTADNTGNINIQSGGSTVMSISSTGVSVTGSFSQDGAVYSTQPTFRNLIINGDMNIAQRGTSVTGITASGYASLDRWYLLEGTDATLTMSQDSDVPTGQGFANSLKIAVTTADTSLTGTQSFRLWQKIEGQNLQQLKFGTANAESITLSFWIKSNLTGNFVVRLLNVDANRQICKLVSIDSANTWEKKTLTYVGDTTGSIDNDNGDSFRVDIWFSAGPDVSSGTLPTTWATNNIADSGAGQGINLVGSTSNYINVTGVQLEVGSTATDFEVLPYDVELARCKRYYQDSGTIYNMILARFNNTAGYAWGWYSFGNEMRATPTISEFGSWATATGYSGVPSFVNITSQGTNVRSASNTWSANTIAYASSGTITMDAEL